MRSSKKSGPLIINLKNYLETAGDNTIKIVKDAEKVSERVDVEIIISPPQPSLALITKQSYLKIISQHVDLKKPGSTTGFYIPEIIEKIGAWGSLINHSEHEIKIDEIKLLIEKLKELKLISIVCVKTIEELMRILEFEPDYIAIEPPELIGTQKSISSEKPYLIRKCSEILNNKSKVKVNLWSRDKQKRRYKNSFGEWSIQECLFPAALPRQTIGIQRFLNWHQHSINKI